jgi:hypothetical protein
MRFLILILFSLISSLSAYADHCPSVDTLKNNKAASWKAYDSDNNKLLSPQREAKLRKQIAQFAMVEWSNAKDKSSIHCYYKNEQGSNMEAYFARDSASPIKSSKYWYPVTGMMQCAAGADKCAFQTLPEMQHRLARNDRELSGV